jgi:hypothetical protein
VDNRNLGKLLGTIAEIEADETLGLEADSPVEQLRNIRSVYVDMHSWCESQMAALTELIEQHEQQAAAPLGK